MSRSRSLFRRLIIGLMMVLSINGVLMLGQFDSQDVSALYHRGVAYFSGSTLSLGASACNVKSDGYYGGPSQANFIATVRDAEGRGYNDYNCAGLDAYGARYVVYTVLGYGVGLGSAVKTSRVSAANWTEFERRINSTTMSSERLLYSSFASNTPRGVACLSSATDYYREDISQYGENCGGSFDAIVFRANGAIVYVVDQKCMNPIGDFPGPPNSNYDLTPTITGSPQTSEGSTAITLNPSVNNAGTTVSGSAQWKATTFTVSPSQPVPGGGDSSQTPEQFYAHNATAFATGNQAFVVNNTPLSVPQQTIGDYPVGTKVCYTLSVQPISQNNSNWRHSIPFCVAIAKKPKVQILGNDLFVGQDASGTIVSSSTRKTINGTDRIFGSWGEYGVITGGTVTGFASGAGYSGGSTLTDFCGVSLLTFTNAGTTTCSSSTAKGGYAVTRLLPAIADRIVATGSLGANPTVDVAGAGTGAYSATGSVSIVTSGTVAKHKWVVINAPTVTVTIKNNIIYANDTIQAISDIPQVVIIADKINIDASVTQVDAWLIATGTTGSINTCTEITDPAQLNANRCNTKLTVNGPVIARHLYLYRTAGAGQGNATGDPAEVFNLRPDAYLWATSYSVSAGRLQTVSSKELPPRF